MKDASAGRRRRGGIRASLAGILGDEGYAVEAVERRGGPRGARGAPLRPGAARHLAAGAGRARGAAPHPRAGRRAAGGDDLGPRHDRDRGQGGAPRRLRLRREAALAREDAARGAGTRCASRRLETELRELRERLDERYAMVGESAAMRRLRAEIAQAAPSNGRVLITGENGTGKELVARAIHAQSQRAAAAVRRGQLRRDPRGADRERAVRPHEGRLHRRPRRAQGQVRARRRRHAVPRRDRAT